MCSPLLQSPSPGPVPLQVSHAFCRTRHRAKPALGEDRAEQGAVAGYLKVISLAEQEALWLDFRVYNRRFELGGDEMGFRASA
jgi:hypothetical protein